MNDNVLSINDYDYGAYSSRIQHANISEEKKKNISIGIEGSIEGLNSFATGWGLSMRAGKFNSLFN